MRRVLPCGDNVVCDRGAQKVRTMNKPEPKATALEIVNNKYPDAEVVFLAGSVVRGEQTLFSDLDLVVVFKELEYAWRESFVYGDWPVEAFLHDPHTLRYFFESVDAPSGRPSLAKMIVEGVALPVENNFSIQMRRLAQEVIETGPPPWDQSMLDSARYMITDLIDDLRAPRNKAEALAAGALLYEKLAEFYLRSQGLWSARGKAIPRSLQKISAPVAEQFQVAFNLLFVQGDSSEVIGLAETILAPQGGFLFEGFTLKAPATWRQ